MAGVAAITLGVAMVGVPTGHAAGRTTPARASAQARVQRGGTVTYLMRSGPEHLDPQRIYIGRDLANAGRLFYRSLVAFPASTDRTRASTPVPDLATTTGRRNADATVWRFTLKRGVRWQDGRPVTCQDLKYGVSRTFATDVITGGPNYVLQYLDVPTRADGSSLYGGPYRGGAQGRAAFDRAITCAGRTITYRFRKPWADFPLAVAGLREFDPYRQDKDRGDASNFDVFSDGPYQLQAGSRPSDNNGFTLVRNPQWDRATDQVRQAHPARFVFEVGVEPEIQYDRLLADAGDDRNAVTSSSAPPAVYSRIRQDAPGRSRLVDSPFTDYLAPRFSSPLMKRPKVRRALALAANRRGWSAGLGGSRASRPAWSVVNPSVPGYRRNPAFRDIPTAGRPARARRLLRSTGLKLPVRLRFTYPGGTPSTDRAAAAMKRVWDRAGFRTVLDPQTDQYYTLAQDPGYRTDVVWGGWGADWPSASTVLAPLFDSRLNLTAQSNGEDYGRYRSPSVNRALDAAARRVDPGRARAAYAGIDATLGRDTAYIPLDTTRFYFLRGSDVAGYVTSPATSSYPDLAVISLKRP